MDARVTPERFPDRPPKGGVESLNARVSLFSPASLYRGRVAEVRPSLLPHCHSRIDADRNELDDDTLTSKRVYKHLFILANRWADDRGVLMQDGGEGKGRSGGRRQEEREGVTEGYLAGSRRPEGKRSS